MIPILKNSAKSKKKIKKKILAIDDDVSIRALLEILLQRKYEVVSKEDGFEAVLWLESGNIPDLIIADIHMPKLNGVQFVKNIKKSGYFRDIPVIMLSGTDDRDTKRQCEEAGVSDFYEKPFNPNDLLALIERLLNDPEEVKANVNYA